VNVGVEFIYGQAKVLGRDASTRHWLGRALPCFRRVEAPPAGVRRSEGRAQGRRFGATGRSATSSRRSLWTASVNF